VSVFLDSNVLFSASNLDSPFSKLLLWLKDKEHFVTSPYAYNEALRNLQKKRPHWIEGLDTLMAFTSLIEEGGSIPGNIDLAQKDRSILAAAIKAECAYLLTGDVKDFGHLYNIRINGVTVVSFADFTDLMLGKHLHE